MAFDAGTFVTALMLVVAVLACLLVINWVQYRGLPAVGVWTGGFLLCVAAAVVVASRGQSPTLVTLDIANSARLLAFGLCWLAARYVAEPYPSSRTLVWTIALAPAAIWLAATWIFLGDDLRPRIFIGAPLMVAFSLAIAAELWRAEHRSPITVAAVVVLTLHAGFVLARLATAVMGTEESLAESFAYPLHPVALAETMVVAITVAVMLLTGVRDHAVMLYQKAAMLDPLTKVSNRRGFEAEVARMLARGRREGTSTSLLLLDLDNFKTINDRWGHPAGDHALRAFTEAVTGELRGGDLLGRFGGDEFAVALANCRPDQAAELANRIRRAAATLTVREGAAKQSLSVSIGVAGWQRADSLDALLKEADAALYRAKAAGRDRVEAAPSDGRPALVA